MAINSGRKIGKEICEILNLDSKKVTRIEFTFTPDDIVYVNVGMIMYEKEFGRFVEVIKQLELSEGDRTPEITGNDELITFE